MCGILVLLVLLELSEVSLGMHAIRITEAQTGSKPEEFRHTGWTRFIKLGKRNGTDSSLLSRGGGPFPSKLPESEQL